MSRHTIPGRTPASRHPTPQIRPLAWKLEDAEARFSEVVRLARTESPQRVTVRGEAAVVVIAVETLEKLLPPAKPGQKLVAFLQDLGIGGLDLTRERDTGREISL